MQKLGETKWQVRWPLILQKGHFSLNFSDIKKPLPVFLSNVRIRIWSFVILQEKHPWKSDSFQNFNRPLFLTGWLCSYHFWLVLRHLIALSRNCSFATLINLKQMYNKLNVKGIVNLNGLWKLYELFGDSSFSLTF